MALIQESPILKTGTRILRPAEFLGLLEGASRDLSSPWGATFLELFLYTGMRYVEGQRFQWAGSLWLKGSFIHLPKEAVLKSKRKQLERYVRLNPQGLVAVKNFLECPALVPTWWGWTDQLRRWAKLGGIYPEGLGPKTMRKTWESWLTYYYRTNPTAGSFIALSQGHDSMTSLNHYLNLPFLPEDAVQMEPFVANWV